MLKTTLRGAVWLFALILLPPSETQAQLRAIPFVSGLRVPVELVQDPSNASVQYVVEQDGVIRVVKDGVVQATPFLDLRALVAANGERGLLGLAFPPNYAASGRFYVYYTRLGDGTVAEVGDIVVARYKRSTSNALVADPLSRKDLVWGSQSYIEHCCFGNHNGGHLAFGPDGYLYIAVGDGGGGNDPTNNAQNPTSLLGKVLRIDVNVPDGHAQGYVVPSDNPFFDDVPVDALTEIWAFGVRNPWKFSFDDVNGGTNALLVADVGQGAREEVNYEPANRGGRNYGWRNREGTRDNQGNVFNPVPPAFTPLTDPVYEYDHSVGNSITGGFVYRGIAMRSAFKGRYFFADFVRGRVWSLGITVNAITGEGSASDVAEHTTELGGSTVLGAISSFGRDATGELYIVSYSGTIFKIVDATPPDDLQVVLFNHNGDSYKDVLLYNRKTGDWAIQLGNAFGTFDPGPIGGWATGWQISVADFNGDGLNDLFLYSISTGVWFKVISTGSGFSYFTQGWQAGFSTFIVDFNGDGKSDVFAYNSKTGTWFTCISTGNGTGGFEYGSGGWTIWSVFPADFDGDGRTDFLLYDPASGLFYKAIFRENGRFAYTSGGWTPGWKPIITSLNGDSYADVFLYSPVTGIWYRATSAGDGTGVFDYAMGGWAAGWNVQTADFDGNGISDFFLIHTNGIWYKVINTGTGFNYFTGGWREGWATTIADLNGDRHSDVFLYDPTSRVWYQALTTTPGGFTYTTGTFPR
jgi:glucose/arabinose dehydrogenase